MNLVKAKQTHSETQEPNGIDIKQAAIQSKVIKEVKLVEPLSKEQAHALWVIHTLSEKKVAIILALDSLSYMKHTRTIDAIQRAKKTSDLDLIIANILLYSEEAAKTVNEKRLQKSNPFYISE